jgi:hypothetical protein
LENPSDYKPRLLLYHLKHKTVTGVRVEGSGRLTRRLTASRSISKFKYMGSLQNLESSRQAVSTVMLRGFMKSNLQYNNLNSYNRNGAFGVKVSVSSFFHTSAITIICKSNVSFASLPVNKAFSTSVKYLSKKGKGRATDEQALAQEKALK